MEYSIVQLLTLLIGPWNAILLTTALVSLVGYYYFYKFLHNRVGLPFTASTLGAMFFIANGFYIERMIVGHLGFQLFPLGSILLYILTDIKRPIVIKAIVTGLLLALIIHHGGFIISIILAFSLVMVLCIVYLYKSECIDVWQLIRTGTLALTVALSLASSKLYAVSAFMHYFPRHISDTYDVSVLQGLVGIGAQLFGMMSLSPIVLITGRGKYLLVGGLSTITGAKYNVWELDSSLSPVLLFLLCFGCLRAILFTRHISKIKLNRGQLLAILLLILTIWINIELTLAKGPIYSLIKQLPILESLHVNPRFASAFILPLTVIGAILAAEYLKPKVSLRPFLLLATLTIAGFSSYLFLSQDLHERNMELSPLSVINREIRNGNRFPIQQIKDIRDFDTFMESATNYRMYEAIFGYSLEHFAPETHLGSVFDEQDGYLNITNPSSLVFPDINRTYPFERIKVGDREKLETFLQRGQPDWQIPTMQKFFNFLSLITLLFCVGRLLVHWLASTHKESKIVPVPR